MGWVLGVVVLVVAAIIAASGTRDEMRALKSTSYADRFMLPGKPAKRRVPDESDDDSD
ncbi:hypothetical protein ACFJGV_14490 [Cnuibacter sp. UC19_7]|uniref:hypothetical protein n=1 Tax=Cnuibacter sp. UC19_7 TaxID=3350166 RepID=UPI0036726CB0